MDEYKEYVLGFAFNPSRTEVVLIRKNRPAWQAGRLNGVGGKVEDDDLSPAMCMKREFKEETGVEIRALVPSFGNTWEHFATMDFENDVVGGKARVYCFKVFTDKIGECKTMESEQVKKYSVKRLLQGRYKTTPNVKILVELALRDDLSLADLTFK